MDWPITFRCNNNCLTCINDMVYHPEKKVLGKKDCVYISTDQIKNKIDSLREKNDETMSFTGGEPTISEDFFELIEYTREKYEDDILLFIVTNGRMFSSKSFMDKMVDTLPPKSNSKFGIAIFGHLPSLHDSITRAEGSFEQTVKGIKNLLDRGYQVELRIIINKMNYEKLPEIAEWISSNLRDVFRVVMIHMKYTGNAIKNFEKIKVKLSESNSYAVDAAETLEKNGINVRMFHFPLCTIPEKHWDKAKGVTKQKEELKFSDKCQKCDVREECPMIWSTYYKIFGDEEINPV